MGYRAISVFATGVLALGFGAVAFSQEGPRFEGRYDELRPEQKRLVNDWVRRYSKTTGKKVSAKGLWEGLPISTRTTFQAVTHALVTTKLTREDGKTLSRSSLDMVQSIDEVAGKIPGAGGDEQFRIYVRLKPDAYDQFMKSQEFRRGMDNTVYHRGFPICLRSSGLPSIQISIARNKLNADIDVDYRPSRFPTMLVNGHLTSSNSDVTAGKNYDKHVGRWQGLENWWEGFFGLPVRKRDVGEKAVSQTPAKPRKGEGSIEEAAQDFLKSWLVEQQPSQAMAYFSPRSFSCMLAGEEKESADRGMAPFRLQRALQAINTGVGKVSSLDAVVTPVTLEDPGARQIRAKSALLSVYEVQDDRAAQFECDYRYGLADPPKDRKPKYGTYYGVAFRLTAKGAQGSPVYTLWEKERGTWKIVSYEVEPLGVKRRESLAVTRAEEQIRHAPGDEGMLQANNAFLEAWLLGGDYEKALEWIAPSCYQCVGLYSDQPRKFDGVEARKHLEEALRSLRIELGQKKLLEGYLRPVTIASSEFEVVVQPHEKVFTVVRVPNGVAHAADCTKRSSSQLLPVAQAEHDKPLYGDFYATGFHLNRGAEQGAAFYLLWSKVDGGEWKITAFHVEMP